MKRIVILIDGTWNEEGKGNDTNIAKLDPNYGRGPRQAFPRSAGENCDRGIGGPSPDQQGYWRRYVLPDIAFWVLV
jgi:uncharacterized protein (DUF2235 family)